MCRMENTAAVYEIRVRSNNNVENVRTPTDIFILVTGQICTTNVL